MRSWSDAFFIPSFERSVGCIPFQPGGGGGGLKSYFSKTLLFSLAPGAFPKVSLALQKGRTHRPKQYSTEVHIIDLIYVI